MNAKKLVEILIVEDNPGDAFLISELFHDIGLELNISVAEDGQKALSALKKEDDFAVATTPDLVVLDLNLPKVHGYEVLAYMKQNPTLKSIPVIVMTGSLNPDDEFKSHNMGATDYLIKPSGREEMDATRQCLKKNLTSLVEKWRTDDGSAYRMQFDIQPCNQSIPRILELKPTFSLFEDAYRFNFHDG